MQIVVIEIFHSHWQSTTQTDHNLIAIFLFPNFDLHVLYFCHLQNKSISVELMYKRLLLFNYFKYKIQNKKIHHSGVNCKIKNQFFDEIIEIQNQK